MSDELITPAEAAQLKGVSTAAIYGAIKEGRLPHTRVLRRIGLCRADVLAWEPRSYAGRPGAKGGKPKGTPTSKETKRRISEAQKRRWARQKPE
ncbi:MAG TPA: helix-turn-helix domain-containing protein [Abditibacteriaceae bacterium]|jgi:excisionase family DNA binding protein